MSGIKNKFAAERGDPKAQTNLGTMYQNGLPGVPQDYVQAVRWYSQAVPLSYPRARANLGRCYYHGLGVGKDLEKTLKLYKKAAQEGDLAGQAGLAYLFLDEHGVEKDIKEATNWLRLSAQQGNPWVMKKLAETGSRSNRGHRLVKKIFRKSGRDYGS